MTGIVNWKQIRHSAIVASHRSDLYNTEFWNQQAESVNNNMTQMEKLTNNHLSRIPFVPEDTVLDVGAGTGRMTIPISERVKHITALEPSKKMITLLKENATKKHAPNIHYINKSLEDLEVTDTQTYDYVLASFSLFMQDIEAALLKMDLLASKAVYIFMSATPWMELEMQCALYGTATSWSDFIFTYNILHDCGILANVEIRDYDINQSFDNLDGAVAKYAQSYRIPPDAHDKLRGYLSQKLVEENGKLCINSKRKAAMIWWTKHK